MKEYSCDYRVFTKKIYIIHGKLKNFKVQLLCSNALFLFFLVFKFTAYHVNFPGKYTIVT